MLILLVPHPEKINVQRDGLHTLRRQYLTVVYRYHESTLFILLVLVEQYYVIPGISSTTVLVVVVEGPMNRQIILWPKIAALIVARAKGIILVLDTQCRY